MSLFSTATNNFFFQHGPSSTCRYIVFPKKNDLWPEDLRAVLRRKTHILQDYLRQQAWNVTLDQVLDAVQTHSYAGGRGLVFDIPHFLVDAQRGILAVESSLDSMKTQAVPHPELTQDQHEDFFVFTQPLERLKWASTSTFSQHFIQTILPSLEAGLRLVKKNDEAIPFRDGFGNNFVTLDVDWNKLHKLAASPKQVWKRFLDISSQKLQVEVPPGSTAPILPLLTSVGAIPHPSLPLPQMSEWMQELYMFPTAVPFTALTITLYSLNGLVYCILSGVRDAYLFENIRHSLLQHGYAASHQGIFVCG